MNLESEIKKAVQRGFLLDQRSIMPHGDRWRGEWPERKFDDILGVCVHQNAGGTDPLATAKYHCGPNHISDKGLPGICYNICILPDGEVWLTEDLLSRTYAQNADDIKGFPGDENTHLISVLVMGDFNAPGYSTGDVPTENQMNSLYQVVSWLMEIFQFNWCGLFGHYHFGKSTCPGTTIQHWIDKVRNLNCTSLTVDKWQQYLKIYGGAFYKGKIDGVWGNKSKRSLVEYQRAKGLRVTGVRDPFTELMIIRDRKLAIEPALESEKDDLLEVSRQLTEVANKIAKLAGKND